MSEHAPVDEANEARRAARRKAGDLILQAENRGAAAFAAFLEKHGVISSRAREGFYQSWLNARKEGSA